ncbi:MAG: hypothetical protein M1830_001471 [Pleopsidium flavum]|nr:MAG: hypothetical protein M1830_001471 [Pleopsidium flavum]
MPSLKMMKTAVVAAKKVPPAKISKNTAKPSTLSAEYVRDSDSEGESDSFDSSDENAPVPIVPKAERPPPPQRKAQIPSKPSSSALRATSPSDSESESESEESEGSSGSEDSSTDSSDIGKHKGADSERSKSPPVTASKRKSTPKSPLTESQPPYKAPSGFESIPTSTLSTSTASRIFSSSGLAGKQIWHITAPTSIPVSVIKEVSLESVAKGEAALTYSGTDYGFVADKEGDQARKKLLIPTANCDGYRSAPVAIAQTLHLQQLVPHRPLTHKQSPSSNSSQVSATAAAAPKKPARQQPEGLKMRFRPFGDQFGKPGKIGSESSSSESLSEVEVAEQEFRMPRSLEAAKGSVKRKHSELTGTNRNQHESPGSTQDGHEARRKKAKHDSSHSKQEPSLSLTTESDTGINSPGRVFKRGREFQQQEDHSRRRETSQERTRRKAKEKGKGKVKEGKAKSTHHGHKHEGVDRVEAKQSR